MIIFSMSCFVYKMSENGKKKMSQDDVLRCLVLSSTQSLLSQRRKETTESQNFDVFLLKNDSKDCENSCRLF